MKKLTAAQNTLISDTLQQYIECGCVRTSSVAGAVEPDSDAMMKHILKCLRALITLARVQSGEKSEKSKLFDVALEMLSNLANSSLILSIDLWPSRAASFLYEKTLQQPSDIKQIRRQGADLQSVYISKTAESYFWAPIMFSTIMDDSPEDFCLAVSRLHEEYKEYVALRGEDSSLLCIDMLLGSSLISDIHRLHILCVLRVRVPWLFFVTDEEEKYPLHLAAFKKCSARVLQYLLRVNPDAANAQDLYGETPLHSLMDGEYEEAKHYDQFKVLLAASKKALRTKDNEGHTPLALVCKQYGTSAPNTVLELLQARPLAASTEDDEGNLPIHYFHRTKCHPEQESLVLTVLQALLAANPSAASEVDSDGDYLLHKIAPHGTLDMVKTVYEAYPDAVKYCDKDGFTSLHLAVLGISVDKVEYVYSLYPEAAEMVVDSSQATLLHCATMGGSVEVLQTAYSYNPGAIRQTAGPYGYLPLHSLIIDYNKTVDAILRNERIGMLRLLLRGYPESAMDEHHTICSGIIRGRCRGYYCVQHLKSTRPKFVD